MGAMRSERLIFNISGEVYETFRNTLQRFPTTLLGDPIKLAPYYCKVCSSVEIIRLILVGLGGCHSPIISIENNYDRKLQYTIKD